ncbi:DUF397 domain-containing protein [Kitasatospora sp. NPDC048298]|uniref:DUF397 domain-containing protein n=1 Tax=Kitasatospora sp. NPDC048298 TaxID=3364049 RepID=UPI003719FC81
MAACDRAVQAVTLLGGSGGSGVEVSYSLPGIVPVRDSKDPESPALTFLTDAWSSFVSAVRSGEFGDV